MDNKLKAESSTEQSMELWKYKLMEQLFDTACNAIVVADKLGRLHYINKLGSLLFDVNSEDTCLYHMHDIDDRFPTQQEWLDFVEQLTVDKELVFDDNLLPKRKKLSIPAEQTFKYLVFDEVQLVLTTIRDLTQVNREKQKLFETHQRLESIFNEMEDVLWSVSIPDYNMLYVTPSVVKLYEIDVDQWLADSSWWSKAIHPEDKAVVDKIFASLSSTGEYNVRYRICTPSGKIKWVRNRGKYIYDENNNPIRIDGIVLDRTSQFNTQLALDQEMKLQEVLIDIASTYINIDPQRVVETINSSLEKMGLFVNADRSYVFDYDFSVKTTSNTFEWCNIGIEPEIQNLQDLPMELFPQWIEQHSMGLPFIVENVDKLNEESADLKRILSDQGIKSLIAIPMLQGKDLVGFVGFDSVRNYHIYSESEKRILFLFGQMLISIRYRQKLDNQLRLQEEKYRNIIANMNLGLLETDSNNIIKYANQSFCDMSGYSLEELIGLDETSILLTEKYQWILQNKSKHHKSSVSDGYEVEVVDKNGSTKWWFVSGAPNFNDKGQLIGTIGIHLDITSQKRLEKELARSKSIAEAASRSKELFLANMSHEIRTPLNVIIGMIRQLAKDDLNEKQSFYVKRAEISAKHLLTILNNVLDIAKIESGDMQIVSQPFSVSSLVSNAHSLMSSQVHEKNLEFVKRVDERIQQVHMGDETRLMQVLINLLGNAVKFTEQGRIELNVQVIEDKPDEQKIRFEVNDTGIGMSKEFIKHVFDKFSQENSSSIRSFEGTGLGMAISNDLVRLMGGVMDIQSIKNVGTSCNFEITLIKASPGTVVSSSKLPTINYFKGKKALLVEDNDMNRFIAIQSLEYLGFEIDTAVNGKLAVEKVRINQYDIILMDIQMPVMDGLEATVRIREKLGVTTPIVALTANAFKKDIEMYLEKGMVGFIIKPYDENDFFRRIERAINHVDIATPVPQLISTSVPAPQVAADSPEKLYDLGLLNKIGKGNPEFLNSMVELFLTLVDESIQMMKKALENLDIQTIRAVAHKMKPSITQMGVATLKESILILEKYELADDDTKELEIILKHVEDTLLIVSEALEKDMDLHSE